MARGKKPAISSYDRRRWLEELDGGKGITTIARESGRDIRIVKRHIEIAREEVQISHAKKEFLLGRLQQHQEDLLSEVNRLRSTIHLPIVRSLVPGDARKKIYEALIEHLKKGSLRPLLESWEQLVQEGETLKRGLIEKMTPTETELKASLCGAADALPWTESVVEDLMSGYVPDESAYNLCKQRDGTYEITYKNRVLSRSALPKKDAEELVESHRKLVTMAGEYEPEIEKYRQRCKELSEMITDELDTLTMKRMVADHCRYCPF